MLLWAAMLVFNAGFVGSMPNAPGVPENITVTFLNPTSVRVSWATSSNTADKYDVMYKPTDARVVVVVAGNSEAVTLTNLSADTQYQMTVTALWAGKKHRSRPIVFRTLEPPRTSPQQDPSWPGATGGPPGSIVEGPSSSPPEPPHELPQIRGVEVGIVVLVLLVWIGAIALFFNRWGKIRMLLPYQPDYKQEQLKVPGTGVCSGGGGGCSGQHGGPGAHACTQHVHCYADVDECAGSRPRTRVNSAIFISTEGPGFDSIEFMRRHGSQSQLCRKARSADNIPLTVSGSGLPTFEVSGPSPPEDDSEQIDDYL